MRRRLLLVLLPLLTALLAALEIPLAQTHAARLTEDLFVEHVAYAEQFAALAEPILRSNVGRAVVEHDLRTYSEITGVTVTVFNNNRESVLHFGAPASKVTAAARDAFLVDRIPARPRTAWPWERAPMIVGETIGKRGPQIGAVVLEVPTRRVREQVTMRIAVLTGAGIAVLLLTTALCALPLARWVLRPVYDLNAAAGRLAAGDLRARASERGGPPEIRGLARAFNHMADNLVAALQRQRAFVADASHELRNPLATLRLRMEALAGKVQHGGERDLRLALSESDRLAATVDRLLELARAEATAAERVDFDVVLLMAQRLAAWTPALESVGSVLRIDAPDEAVSHGSPDSVAYALDVLLDNAHKFAPGTPIDVAIDQHADCVVLSVRDHGPGLTASDLARIGERFWRSARHRAVPGTGLGLATARALLESAGATIEVTSGNPGLVVVLRLPTPTGALADTSAQRPDANPAETSQSQHAD